MFELFPGNYMWTQAAFRVLSSGGTMGEVTQVIAGLQEASGARVEVNLFHRTEERVEKIRRLLESEGVKVLTGRAEPLLPLSHPRALCLREGIFSADTVLVPLEDGDRCAALVSLGKRVIAIDLNPLSRTARTATLTVVDELTRALPNITAACRAISPEEGERLMSSPGNSYFLKSAMDEMRGTLEHALD